MRKLVWVVIKRIDCVNCSEWKYWPSSAVTLSRSLHFVSICQYRHTGFHTAEEYFQGGLALASWWDLSLFLIPYLSLSPCVVPQNTGTRKMEWVFYHYHIVVLTAVFVVLVAVGVTVERRSWVVGTPAYSGDPGFDSQPLAVSLGGVLWFISAIQLNSDMIYKRSYEFCPNSIQSSFRPRFLFQARLYQLWDWESIFKLRNWK